MQTPPFAELVLSPILRAAPGERAIAFLERTFELAAAFPWFFAGFYRANVAFATFASHEYTRLARDPQTLSRTFPVFWEGEVTQSGVFFGVSETGKRILGASTTPRIGRYGVELLLQIDAVAQKMYNPTTSSSSVSQNYALVERILAASLRTDNADVRQACETARGTRSPMLSDAVVAELERIARRAEAATNAIQWRALFAQLIGSDAERLTDATTTFESARRHVEQARAALARVAHDRGSLPKSEPLSARQYAAPLFGVVCAVSVPVAVAAAASSSAKAPRAPVDLFARPTTKKRQQPPSAEVPGATRSRAGAPSTPPAQPLPMTALQAGETDSPARMPAEIDPHAAGDADVAQKAYESSAAQKARSTHQRVRHVLNAFVRMLIASPIDIYRGAPFALMCAGDSAKLLASGWLRRAIARITRLDDAHIDAHIYPRELIDRVAKELTSPQGAAFKLMFPSEQQRERCMRVAGDLCYMANPRASVDPLYADEVHKNGGVPLNVDGVVLAAPGVVAEETRAVLLYQMLDRWRAFRALKFTDVGDYMLVFTAQRLALQLLASDTNSEFVIAATDQLSPADVDPLQTLRDFAPLRDPQHASPSGSPTFAAPSGALDDTFDREWNDPDAYNAGAYEALISAMLPVESMDAAKRVGRINTALVKAVFKRL